ncbi:MAG: hypothetical protein QOI04_1569 [Verrucomicrobiota bacterium]|jgi:hypothetical protein
MSAQPATKWAEENEIPVTPLSIVKDSRAQAGGEFVLPPPIDIADLLTADLPEPTELVSGLLHKGSKMVIGGGSKSFKTWALLDLALSVASGTEWWGCGTTQGRVLYMNFEIQNFFFRKRFGEVLAAKGSNVSPGQFMYSGLRGKSANLGDLMPGIIATLKTADYSLIVIDPIYKALGDRDENKAGDIASLLNEIEKLAVETGAAAVFGHHYSKGNQGKKESIDRIGGSGVFARDPDTVLTMTRHAVEDAFTVDAVLRNFPPMEPFVIRREHPLMVRDETLLPTALKLVGPSQQKFTDDDILASIGGVPMTTTAWQRDAYSRCAISESNFHVRRRKLLAKGLIQRVGKEWIKTVK